MLALTTTTGSCWKPGSSVASDMNVRMKSPAATISTRDSATCEDDEHVAEAEAAVGRTAAPLFLERFVWSHTGRAEGGRHPEEQSRCDRYDAGECEDTPVQRQIQKHAVRGGRELSDEQTAAPLSEEQTEQCAEPGEQQALSEQQTASAVHATRRVRNGR